MFIKLHFRCSVGEPQLRIVKVSRIQEVRPPTYDRWGAQVQLSGDKKFHDVVENIDEIIFQLDKEGRLIFLNPSWTEVTGCSMTETLGTHINLYVYPDDRLRHQSFMAMNQMNNHESFRAEFRYVTKAGENLWVEIHTRLLEDAEGEASSLFGSINDITNANTCQ